jgi:gas vesicle protein
MNQTDIREWFFDVLPFQRKSSTDWILPSAVGLGIGIAAGVGIGILLAPRPGVETRERLREGAENLKEKARERAENLKGKAREGAENFKEKARDFADRAKEQLTSTTHTTHTTQPLGNGLASSYVSELPHGR